MTIKRVKKRLATDRRIPVLSFFTGGGFLDIGFEQAGFEVVWTNEIDSVFADMYSFENAELLGPEMMDDLRGLIDKYGRMEVFKVCQWLPKIMAAAES